MAYQPELWRWNDQVWHMGKDGWISETPRKFIYLLYGICIYFIMYHIDQ
jgi:hypothetical protein